MRKVWKLPNLTHCNLLSIITNCISLNIIIEKRLLKFIWSIINSENLIDNNVFKFAYNNLEGISLLFSRETTSRSMTTANNSRLNADP